MRKDIRKSDPMWLFFWPCYLLRYILLERYVPARGYVVIYSFLDEWIPFCEWFLIPYVFWYGLLVFSLGYFLLYDVGSFRRLQCCLMVIQAVAIAIYILLPTRQDLRPVVFPRDNPLTRGVALLYRVDTNTGVCPSMHVAFSLAMVSAWLRRRETPLAGKLFVAVAAGLICLSTMFIKQHSALDFFAAIPVCLLAERLVRRWI